MSERKIKIAFVIHGLVMGGAEKFLLNLINYLPNDLYSSHLILLSSDNKLLSELKKGTPYIIFSRNSKFDLSISRKIKNYLLQHKIHHVFCINTYSFFLSKLHFLFSSNINFILSNHSTIPASLKNYFQNLIYYRFLSDRDTTIYLCDAQLRYLENKYHFQGNKNVLINNGIDTAYFNPNNYPAIYKSNYRKQLGFGITEKLIIMVARIHPEKGHEEAIQALSMINTDVIGPIHLLFIGGGEEDYLLKLKNLVSKYQIEDRVHFLGEQMDVRPFLHISDIFTLASHSTETFSLSALEAMAFGLPCSLTNIGGASEMIVEGLNGILTTPRDPISIARSWEKLLSLNYNRSLIREYVIKNFSVHRMINLYDSFFRSMITTA